MVQTQITLFPFLHLLWNYFGLSTYVPFFNTIQSMPSVYTSRTLQIQGTSLCATLFTPTDALSLISPSIVCQGFKKGILVAAAFLILKQETRVQVESLSVERMFYAFLDYVLRGLKKKMSTFARKYSLWILNFSKYEPNCP